MWVDYQEAYWDGIYSLRDMEGFSFYIVKTLDFASTNRKFRWRFHPFRTDSRLVKGKEWKVKLFSNDMIPSSDSIEFHRMACFFSPSTSCCSHRLVGQRGKSSVWGSKERPQDSGTLFFGRLNPSQSKLEGIEHRCPYFLSVNLFLIFLFLLFVAIPEFDFCCRESQKSCTRTDRINNDILRLTI